MQGGSKLKRLTVLAVVAAAATAIAAGPIASSPADPGAATSAKKGKKKQKKKDKGGQEDSPLQRAVFVGNNWDGTADILIFKPPRETVKRKLCRTTDGAQAAKKKGCKKKKGRKSVAAVAAKGKRCKSKSKGKGKKSAEAAKKRKCKSRRRSTEGSFQRVARLNIIPDIDERMAEIQNPLLDPTRLPFFLGIRLLIGEGNDQFVDDMYSTNDGRLLIVSRPSLRDVIGMDIATGKIVWRFVVDGQRSDHMGVSPSGKYVAVSASTGNVVHILDVNTGREVGRFPSGDSPHENTYSKDGSKIFHASIGLVYTPADQPQIDTTKGERYFQIVDANTNAILRRVDMGERLAAAGYPNMSSAVRPMAISPDEQRIFLQVSFFHGYVEYDVPSNTVVRVVHLPNEVPALPREAYLLDSAHHGIAINEKGTRLCVAGTMSDYAAVVQRGSSTFELLHKGEKPYWSTTSDDGDFCFVSWSGTDKVSAISYESAQEIASIQVGDHPQRVRTGWVRTDWVRSQGG